MGDCGGIGKTVCPGMLRDTLYDGCLTVMPIIARPTSLQRHAHSSARAARVLSSRNCAGGQSPSGEGGLRLEGQRRDGRSSLDSSTRRRGISAEGVVEGTAGIEVDVRGRVVVAGMVRTTVRETLLPYGFGRLDSGCRAEGGSACERKRF